MRKLLKLVAIIFAFTSTIAHAQTVTTSTVDGNTSGFQMSARVGYDVLPMYKNNTPFIDYNAGIEFGVSADYYWNWIGVGADFDYIKNSPSSIYPTDNLYDGATLLNSFNLDEQSITRIFYGIGPDFRYLSGSFMAELNTRVGMSNIKGGRTLLEETTTASPGQMLNFHAGYDANVLAAKAQVRFTYFFTDNFGVHLGAYYMNHFSVPELEEGGISAYYKKFNEVSDVDGDFYNLEQEDGYFREACENNISSIGVFAGLTYRFKAKKECEVCCKSYALAVTAKDKFTGELLPNTDVAIKNLKEK